jgi:hypothetical protein
MKQINENAFKNTLAQLIRDNVPTDQKPHPGWEKLAVNVSNGSLRPWQHHKPV